VRKIRPNFKTLGPKYGKLMKEISAAVSNMTPADITAIESSGIRNITAGGHEVTLTLADVEIVSEDIPGWQVANEGRLTVALDVTVSDELRYEGIAREFVNRIQNIRKENGYDVTDKITVNIEDHEFVRDAVEKHKAYIGSQTLATSVNLSAELTGSETKEVDIDEVIVKIQVSRSR
jgi:isoleucyl-tRNA synthetase